MRAGRAALSLLCATACGRTEHTLTVVRQEDGALAVMLTAPTGHEFTRLSATANGTAMDLVGSGPGSEGVFFSQASTAAMARFSLAADRAPTDTQLSVSVADGGERFELVAPSFNALRSFAIAAQPDGSIDAGDVVATTASPVAADEVAGSIGVGTAEWPLCLGGDDAPCAGCLAFRAAADMSWWCGDRPQPGQSLAGEVWALVTVRPSIGSCEGPGLTCGAELRPAHEVSAPVTLRF